MPPPKAHHEAENDGLLEKSPGVYFSQCVLEKSSWKVACTFIMSLNATRFVLFHQTTPKYRFIQFHTSIFHASWCIMNHDCVSFFSLGGLFAMGRTMQHATRNFNTEFECSEVNFYVIVFFVCFHFWIFKRPYTIAIWIVWTPV